MRLTPRHRRFPVHRWWPPGRRIDLGDRTVELLHLPGHTADSVGLLDRAHDLVLAGDTVYHAPGRFDGVVLAGAIPSSSVAGYLRSAELLAGLAPGRRVLAGHYQPDVDRRLLAGLAEALQVAEHSSWASAARPWRRFTTFRSGRARLIVGRGAARSAER